MDHRGGGEIGRKVMKMPLNGVTNRQAGRCRDGSGDFAWWQTSSIIH